MLYYTLLYFYFIIKLVKNMTEDSLNRLIYNANHKNKITQENLAEIINVSTSFISLLESNKSNKGISISNLYKISIVLETPISKFLEE